MSALIAVSADLLVAVLLVATIVTSVRLSRRMALLKADESAMRATIGELVAATDSAERAIAGLRATVQESERALSDRLGAALRHSTRLAEQVSAGETVMARVAQIASLSQRLGGESHSAPAGPEAPTPSPAPAERGLRATILAARDVAERSARRLGGEAA